MSAMWHIAVIVAAFRGVAVGNPPDAIALVALTSASAAELAFRAVRSLFR